MSLMNAMLKKIDDLIEEKVKLEFEIWSLKEDNHDLEKSLKIIKSRPRKYRPKRKRILKLIAVNGVPIHPKS